MFAQAYKYVYAGINLIGRKRAANMHAEHVQNPHWPECDKYGICIGEFEGYNYVIGTSRM